MLLVESRWNPIWIPRLYDELILTSVYCCGMPAGILMDIPSRGCHCWYIHVSVVSLISIH